MDKHEKISKSFYTHVRRNTVRNIFIYCNSLIRNLTSVVHIITAIIASIILVEIIHLLPLKYKDKVVITVIASLSIGIGAALTLIGYLYQQ
ncbi:MULTISPECIES: DUF1646 family protein [Caldanaerobacter]|uniref:DUF1646 family protein n=1 Tax=Caldanaerobacter TaxID=249529 RepID=UPI00104AE2C9|nr:MULTISPECIES: DUF1646 family protein [Caldanaerobacter]